MSLRGPTYSSLSQPTSPLNPRMDSLNLPQSPRRRPARQHNSNHASSLRLPSLPRFHPANFPSQHTSASTTPATGPNSPQPPVSPRSQQKQYSDAQKQLYMYQRELLMGTTAGMGKQTSSSSSHKPTSPRLIPMGSPGPVTPLELEEHQHGNDSYLLAGSKAKPALASDYVEKLIKQEAKRMASQSTARPSSAVGGR